MSSFQSAKVWLLQLLGLPKDALHIYVGLLIFLGVAALFRRSLSSPLPMLAVLTAALAGEVWDVFDTWRAGQPIYWWRNWHDVWNTSFWPAILFLLTRYTRVLKR